MGIDVLGAGASCPPLLDQETNFVVESFPIHGSTAYHANITHNLQYLVLKLIDHVFIFHDGPLRGGVKLILRLGK